MDNFALICAEQGKGDDSFFEIFSERCFAIAPFAQETPMQNTLAGKDSYIPSKLKKQMLAMRLKLLNEAIIRCKGNKKQATRELGISYTTLRRFVAPKQC